MNKLLTLLLLVCLVLPAMAQVPGTPTPVQQVQLEQLLADRDIDEAELRQRLAARGIDVDNLSPQEAVRVQPQIEAVIAEMEEEKARQEAAKKEVAKPADEIEVVNDAPSAKESIPEEPEEASVTNLPKSKIYGHQVFRNKSLKVYQAAEGATPPESYPLKSGDEIAVTIFGASQSDFILRVDESGFVQLPTGSRISLAGVPLGAARRVLANRLKRSYTFRDGQLNIRIQAASTISVNIFGEVENNGSFAMSSLNTGFNALVAAGGPTERGTVRNIQLIRGDETTELDVYDYLRNPTSGSALFLNNNATIFVPMAETIVSLEGGVQRPMDYELKRGENISDLVTFAGGLVPRAETRNIQVTRFVEGALEIINVDLSESPGFSLMNEDVVNIPVINNPIENFVTIEGAVLLPGRYPFNEGITLAQLLEKGRIRPGARKDAAFLFRTNDDGTSRLIKIGLGADAGAGEVALQRGDRLRVLAQSAYVDQATFTVSGAVRDSEVTLPFPQDGALTLDEAVLLAGGVQTNAEPEVMLIRTPLTNQEEKKYQRLDLRTSGNFALQPLDKVLVFQRERFTDRATVKIAGAVRTAGEYTYDPSLTLSDLIYLAGGTRIDAAPDRVEVFRLQINEGTETRTLLTTVDLNAGVPLELRPYDEVIVRSIAEFETIQKVVVQGEVRYPGTYALLEDNERLTDLVRRAGGMTTAAFPAGATLYRGEKEVGFVVLDLDEVIENPVSTANMVLVASDTLFIPKREDLVTIYTENTLANRFGKDSTTVDGSIQVAYRGPKSARWYINNYAGGFNDDTARKRWTTVESASGGVKETKNFMGIKSYPEISPGSSIRVAAAPKKQQKERREERFDWLRLTQIILGTATTITTYILLRN